LSSSRREHSTDPRRGAAGLAIALLIAAMCCFQAGASLAKGLFPLVGAAGTTALRTGLASILLVAVWRPWRMRVSRLQARDILIYGASLGVMNLAFYSALKLIPLGIAVALEFTGPLAVAVIGSRRPIDFLWIALAVLGLLVLLPIGAGSAAVAPVGVMLALLAGACWALYIVYGRRAGAAHGGQTTALGMLTAALLTVPVGLAESGSRLLSVDVLPLGLALAVVSSALPYSLEMIAMPRLPAKTVGVLMSLEPAVAAMFGLLLLNEHLTLLQWVAIGSIMVASAGSASARDAKALPN
jgi:inner membrane transporter RhtA